ncbi:MAG TPA: sugar phosphate nucleotidyltransferase [Steroidobacteraceae bacterium]|nr:sugar phosphate nucleotidyltransferase [Steroidobacteraceae bacterium]
MTIRSNTWALVLAAGDGSRLRRLTQNEHGVAVPKQFCSLQGGPCLLQEALQRAAAVAPLARICSIVAEQHREWWTPILSYLSDPNVIVQPHNKGTAYGILLPLLRMAERDPNATVVLLPADHYLRHEEILAASLRRAAELAKADAGSIYLLGIEPDEPDTELGYILPAPGSRQEAAEVLRFIEKPDPTGARVLLDEGALWNSFILAASSRALLGLFDGRYAATIAALRGFDGANIDFVYRNLKSVDFSRDVLQGKESLLKVLTVPHCGWTDLGTPERVGAILEQLSDAEIVRHPYFPAHVSLADRYARMHREPGFAMPAERADLRNSA